MDVCYLSGCEPSIMGIGPVPAVEGLLKATDMKLQDMDLVEVRVTHCVHEVIAPNLSYRSTQDTA